jgi:hypothetical protein
MGHRGVGPCVAYGRKPAFLLVIAANAFYTSQVDRARRSSRVITSPGASGANNRRSCARSVCAPLAVW